MKGVDDELFEIWFGLGIVAMCLTLIMVASVFTHSAGAVCAILPLAICCWGMHFVYAVALGIHERILRK